MTVKQKRIRFYEHGGPEVLKFEEGTLPELAPHEVRIKHQAIGVNFIDTYYRTGLYQTPLPTSLGTEAAGVVEAVGIEVKHLQVGERVVYAQGPLGSYADRRHISADLVVKIPDNVSSVVAASVLLKGLTVSYLFKDVYAVKRGETILFHAAAGGVGLIACQWARHLGVKLIGTVSNDKKEEAAREAGAWEVINYNRESISAKVIELTDGKKVPVVYDGIGKVTWEESLNSLRPKGLMVSFGNASGPVTGVSLSTLTQKGSLFVTRPILAHYVDTPVKLQQAAKELFRLVGEGIIHVDKIQQFPLGEASAAHQMLADRNRVGGVILIP